MERLNQLIVSGKHCAPTSLTMVLSALLNSGITPIKNSWVDINFLGKTKSDQIYNMGELLETSSADGTDTSNTRQKVVELSSSFLGINSIVATASSNFLNNKYFINSIRDKTVGLIGYGHYSRSCETILSEKICSYTRGGGHAVALNGYKIGRRSSIVVYDPWEGLKKTYSLSLEKNRSKSSESFHAAVDLRPYMDNTMLVYHWLSQVKIVDYYAGLKKW